MRLRHITDNLRRQAAKQYQRLFPSPAELRIIEIMGGKVLRINRIISQRSGLPMAIILSRGGMLRREHFKRTGDDLVLFSNDLKWGLAIQGAAYERNIIEAFERDQTLKENGYRIQYLPVRWLVNRPDLVRDRINQFVYS